MVNAIKKLADLTRKELKKGTSPKKISLGVALGATLGIFPIPGASTVLCGLTALGLRLNQAIIQMVNYAVYPLQLLLLGGYFALGNQWFGGNGTAESLGAMYELLRNDPWAGILSLKQLGGYAVVAWLVTSPLVAVGIYFFSRFFAGKLLTVSSRNRMLPSESETADRVSANLVEDNRQHEEKGPTKAWQSSQEMGCLTCLA